MNTIYDAIQSSVFGKNIELVEQIMQDNYSSTVELNKDQNIMTQVLQAVANIPSNDALYAYSQIIFLRYRYMMKYWWPDNNLQPQLEKYFKWDEMNEQDLNLITQQFDDYHSEFFNNLIYQQYRLSRK